MVGRASKGRASEGIELALDEGEHERPATVGVEVAAEHAQESAGVATGVFHKSVGLGLVWNAEVVPNAG